jgi:hypothetical protein
MAACRACHCLRKHETAHRHQCMSIAPVLRLLCPARLCQALQVPAARGQVGGPAGPQPLARHLVRQQWDGHASVGALPRQHLKQQDAVGVHVAGLADVARQEQLRRHVRGGALQKRTQPHTAPQTACQQCFGINTLKRTWRLA